MYTCIKWRKNADDKNDADSRTETNRIEIQRFWLRVEAKEIYKSVSHYVRLVVAKMPFARAMVFVVLIAHIIEMWSRHICNPPDQFHIIWNYLVARLGSMQCKNSIATAIYCRLKKIETNKKTHTIFSHLYCIFAR